MRQLAWYDDTRKILLAILAYAMVGFAVMGYYDARRHAVCDHFEPGFRRGLCYQQNFYWSVMTGLLWPVGLPARLGSAFADPASSNGRTSAFDAVNRGSNP